MEFANPSLATTQGGPLDWSTLKSEIIGKLDVAAEFTRLGVEFTKDVADSRGVRECRAVGRRDDKPSAMVNIKSGVYHDSGGVGESLHLFDFALKYGNFGSWSEVLKHFAMRAGVDVGSLRPSRGGRILEATYLYHDADGAVRYAVFRYRQPNGKKSFSQHPPDGKGGWVYGAGCMNGVEPAPYRLPDVVASASTDEPIWIVEGEKDADRLTSLGLVATTNHQGALSTDLTWPRFLRYFESRECYILPDNDAGGRMHAAKVAAYLAPLARVVKVVALPGLAPKGDVSDWFDQGHNLDDLGRLAAAAPVWSPDATAEAVDPFDEIELPPDKEVVMVRLSDLRPVPVDWLWPNRIPLGKITLLAGLAKQGKSFFTMDLAARVSSGKEIPGGTGECFDWGAVVLLSAEDDLDDTVLPRLLAAGATTDRIQALTTLRQPDGSLEPFTLSHIPHLERAILRQEKTKLVIIDPITHYVGSKVDDNKTSQLRAMLGPLKDMASRRKVAVVVVSHLNKGTGTNALHRVVGSTAYTALARANWLIVRDPNEPKRRLFLDAGTNLAEDPTGLAYRIVDGRLDWESHPVELNASEALAAESKQEKDKDRPFKIGGVEQAAAWLQTILASVTEVSSAELFSQGEAKGFSRDHLYRAKAKLGVKAVKTGNNWVWRLSLPNPPADQGQDWKF